MGYSFVLIRKIRTAEEFTEVEKLIYGDDQNRLEKKFESCVNTLDWYKKPRRVIRSNGVRAVLFSFSYHDADCNIDEWVSACRSWLGSSFIVNNRVLLAWKAVEGVNEGHAYAVLIPIDVQEKISYRYYFSKRSSLLEKLNSYCELMKQNFDLQKPSKETLFLLLNSKNSWSFSTPEEDLPEPIPKENIADYHNRISEYLLHRHIMEVNRLLEENSKLKDRIQEIEKDSQILYRLTKQAGAPDKWGPMLHTAQRLQYAIRSYQESADQEGISAVANILRVGDNYMKKHRIRAIK